jgi:hypothetical protein
VIDEETVEELVDRVGASLAATTDEVLSAPAG